MYILLMLIPSIVGIIIFLFYATPEQVHSVFIIIKWIGAFTLGLMLLKLLAGNETEKESDTFLYSSDKFCRPIPEEDIEISDIDGHTKHITHLPSGKQYLIQKDREGIAYFIRLDERGRQIGYKEMGAPNSWRFGKSPNKKLSHVIREELNREKENSTRKRK